MYCISNTKQFGIVIPNFTHICAKEGITCTAFAEGEDMKDDHIFIPIFTYLGTCMN